MASRAIVKGALTASELRRPPAPLRSDEAPPNDLKPPVPCTRGDGFNHLTAVILAARTTNMVRALQFAAIRAFSVGSGDQGMVRTPHVAPRLGGFLFRNSHCQDSLL